MKKRAVEFFVWSWSWGQAKATLLCPSSAGCREWAVEEMVGWKAREEAVGTGGT